MIGVLLSLCAETAAAVFQALAAAPSLAGSAVFDGLDGTAVDAGYAVCTLLAPRRAPVYHRDGTEGAAAVTFAAGGTDVGYRKQRRFDKKAVEPRVDSSGLQMIQPAFRGGKYPMPRIERIALPRANREALIGSLDSSGAGMENMAV